MVGSVLHLHGNSTVHFSCRSNLNRSPLPAAKLIITQKMTRGEPSSWASLQAELEAHIKQAMPMKEPLIVFEPMRHLTFAAPPTTVPALCVAACELVGGQRAQAMPAASALLLMQAATYTHEHLPLTDRPKPKPEIHHVYGPNIELLTGDGIIPFGFEILARSDDPTRNNSDWVLRVIIEIARAVGSEGLVEGQYRKFVMMSTELDSEEVCHVASIEKVEAGMHACGAACGAVSGGGSEDQIERLRKFGFYVGMIQGLLQRLDDDDEAKKKEAIIMEEVQKVRDLALKELECFQGRKLEEISSFINY